MTGPTAVAGAERISGQTSDERHHRACVRWAQSQSNTNLPGMIRDPDRDPLRDRADFQLLLMDLVMPADPFARAE
jgi:hypothetical protein